MEKWAGASRWVPVCSEKARSLEAYQLPPGVDSLATTVSLNLISMVNETHTCTYNTIHIDSIGSYGGGGRCSTFGK